MTSTAEQVNRHLEGDVVMNEALARGVLNLRRAARWLIESRGWDTSEEAVVSALRRYEAPTGRPGIEEAHRLLSQASVNVRSGLALATMPRVRELQQRLPSFWWKVDGEDILGLLCRPTSIHFVLEDETLEQLKEALGPGALEDLNHPVSEIRFTLPEDGWGAPISAAVVLNVFGHRGLDVLDVFGADPEISLMVPGCQGTHAYEAATGLVELLYETQ